jgi:hypothetical protein
MSLHVGNTGTIAVTTGGGTGTSIGTFTVNTPPTVTVTASTNPICSGSSTTLTAVGANMGGGGSYLYNPGALVRCCTNCVTCNFYSLYCDCNSS